MSLVGDPVPTVLAGSGLAVLAAGGARLLFEVVRRLPEPDPELAAERHPEEPPKPRWADLVEETRWRLEVAVVAGVLGLVLGIAVGPSWALLLVGPLAPVGAVLALVDARTRLLPRRLVWPATAVAVTSGVVGWVASGLASDPASDLVRGLVVMVLAWAVLGALWWWVPAGVGFGDVRMVGWLGFLLGHTGWTAALIGLYAPFLLFGAPGLLLALARRDRSLLRRAFPFGPFLVAGAVLGVVAEALVGAPGAG